MTQRLVKMHFGLDAKDWHGHGGEFLWAAPIDEKTSSHFRISNSPYFAKAINHGDIVEATPSGDKAIFEFQKVVERSGHSTYMLIVKIGSPQFPPYWKMLEDRGCSYESMEMNFSIGRRQLLSVDVPPSASIFEVYDILQKGEADGAWAFQEGYAHLPKK